MISRTVHKNYQTSMLDNYLSQISGNNSICKEKIDIRVKLYILRYRPKK